VLYFAPYAEKRRAKRLLTQVEKLPIYQVLDELETTLQAHQIVLLEAPPGAGKSTVVPLALLDAAWLMGEGILMLEPRRLAARSVAGRMAKLDGTSIGEKVGYSVRFERKVSSKTRLEVVTEGLLTRRLQQDPTLEGVGCVIFDEFHERNLDGDLSLALTRQIQQVLRPELRILIMSATLGAAELALALGKGKGDRIPIVKAEGRSYPIDIVYGSPVADARPLATRVAGLALRALKEQKEGSVLVFLPGQGDILRCKKQLEIDLEKLDSLKAVCDILPLYGDLSLAEQQRAISEPEQGKRHIVLATSIAETSLTIPALRAVVDSGFTRTLRFDHRAGLSKLETVRITHAAATQRAGRAGRLSQGICYRLWAVGSEASMVPDTVPEILEADLTQLALNLACWGTRVNDLEWVTAPPPGAIQAANELLERLGAIKNGIVTDYGKALNRIPLHPRLAKMLLAGAEAGIGYLACQVATLLEEKDPLGKEFEQTVDLQDRVEWLKRMHNTAAGERCKRSITQLEKVLGGLKIAPLALSVTKVSIKAGYEVGWLIAAAYPERVAKLQEGSRGIYRLTSGRVGRLGDSDHLAQVPWLAIAQLDMGQKEGIVFLAAELDPVTLEDRLSEGTVVGWDEKTGALLCQREWKLEGLLVRKEVIWGEGLIKYEKDIASATWSLIRKKGLGLLGFGEGEQEWQARVSSIGIWQPDGGWPDVSTPTLLLSVEEWAGPYLGDILSKIRKVDDLLQFPLSSALKSILNWEQQRMLEILAPAKLEVPTGSHIRLLYELDGSLPVLAVRVQEVFGLLDTPTVLGGKKKVMLHLLSPGYRPLQQTQDLAGFWERTYQQVRNELRARYPRHAWPDDPARALPVRKGRSEKY
jgi:ATP-dependent helicase HrpB